MNKSGDRSLDQHSYSETLRSFFPTGVYSFNFDGGFWTHVSSFHVLWGHREGLVYSVCQRHLIAHILCHPLSLFHRAMLETEALKRWKERGGKEGEKRGRERMGEGEGRGTEREREIDRDGF